MAQVSEWMWTDDGGSPSKLNIDTQISVPSYKRPFDVAFGSILLVLSAPLFVVVALLVKLTSRGPVLFRQERIGQRGVPFTVLKFRTMRADAESTTHRNYFMQYLNGVSAPGEPSNVFKLRRDSRITSVGRFLRRLGLDELPQLINVLKGEMSLVGPRPPLAYEVAHYSNHHLLRLATKPGITGLWQIRGRDVVDFDTMVGMDLEYVQNMSPTLDLKILILTVPSLVWALVKR
jgi:lipopolysaccharide/colanic/teichoic acid biosynthesis glycosyltransferase